MNATPRIRFNWGYHDGADDVLRGIRRPLPNPKVVTQAYYEGYLLGKRDAQQGTYQAMGSNPRSDAAWKEWNATRGAKS